MATKAQARFAGQEEARDELEDQRLAVEEIQHAVGNHTTRLPGSHDLDRRAPVHAASAVRRLVVDGNVIADGLGERVERKRPGYALGVV